MSENNIKGIIDVTVDKLRTLIDADTVIGTPIQVGEITLIPVSRISYGLATGGSDFPSKNQSNLFGGGGGAGASIIPISFIAVNGTDVKMLPISNEITNIEKAITLAPEFIQKIKDMFTKEK